MRLIECYVEGFGKLSKKKYDFSSGFNCINEENGSGKTTLAAFIKVMLYGMSDTKKTSLEENDRKHYMPWSGGVCGGTLTFEAGRKTYRAERTFAPKAADDSFALYDITLGRLSEDYTERLGEELFGIDADGFERTVFLSERALTPKSDNKSISAKLSNLVGCDGDICDMDDALKTLEDARRFYQKKGGSGELADIKTRITDITKRLEALGETELALAAKEKRLYEIADESKQVREETRALIKDREAATLRVARSGYEKLHREMKEALDESVRKSEKIFLFFGGNPPSFDEIDDAYFKSAEAKRLLEAVCTDGASKEYEELRNYFNAEISDGEVERAKSALEVLKARCEMESDPSYIRMRTLFAKRVPEASEIEALILARQKKSKLPAVLSAIGAVFAALGAGLGAAIDPIMLLLLVPAAALISTGVALSARKRKTRRKSEAEFFSSLSERPIPSESDVLTALYEMKNIQDSARVLLDEESINEQKRIISALEAKLPHAKNPEEIIAKYERYRSILVAEQYMQGERAAKLERARVLKSEAERFLARFNTLSDDPFTELRRALTEFNMLSSEILSKRSEIEHLASMHSLGEGAERKAELSLEEVDLRRHRLEERAAELSRELALTERACKDYEGELEERDELIMRRAELEERLATYKENYEIILLTKKYLTKSRDNLTVRYLGKTKSSFEKYAEAISGISGDGFLMDTDFGVSKTDGGATRPQDAYSKGTRDLYNIATRLALVDSLYESEKPFIIMDDPFCSFDDKKTEAALKLLKEFARDRQIIYFTCSKSREA